MYAHVIASTGWTWDQVDQLTIPRFDAMSRYWKRFPPIHIMVAAYFGFGKDEAKQPPAARDDLGALLSAWG